MVEFVRAFGTNQRVTYEGELVQFDDGILSVPMRNDLPIFIAGMGSQTIQLAGELGDGLIISSCVADVSIDHTLELLAKGAAKAGRDPSAVQLASRVNVSISDDGDAARQAVKQRLAPMIVSKRPDFSFLDQVGLTMPPAMADLVASARYAYDDEARAHMRRIGEAMPDEFADRLGIAGTRSEVAASLQRMSQRGVKQLIAYPLPVPGQKQTDVLRELAIAQGHISESQS
jgi:alkanesulfonate monooxygenase SsuD/methylene tetrahydromethanopterin reductase-like flavin-dependent oxidoreductase (luciferase family)